VLDVSELPALERIQLYLDFADDARREAETVENPLRESYLAIAEQWDRLAADVAKTLNSGLASHRGSSPKQALCAWRGEWLRRVK